MADFWVSRAKHYCKFCKCWTQGDKISINRHEAGPRHKNQVRRSIYKANKQKQIDQSKEKRLQRELDQINRAAHRIQGTVAHTTPVNDTKRPTIHHAPQRPKPTEQKVAVEEEIDDGDEFEVAQDEIFGQYSMDDQVYLQGKWHQDLLSTFSKCQAINPTSDDWENCTIEKVNVEQNFGAPVSILYAVLFETEDEAKQVIAEDIRILAPGPPKTQNTKPQIKATGIGTWETVTIIEETQKNDGLDALDRAMMEQREQEIAPESGKHGKITAHGVKDMGETDAHGDDAYSILNPFGGTYKGFDIIPSKDEKRLEVQQIAATSSKVKFKKRKRKPQMGRTKKET